MSLTLHSPTARNLPSGLLLLAITLCWLTTQATSRFSPVSASVSSKHLKHFKLTQAGLERQGEPPQFAVDTDQIGLKAHPELQALITTTQDFLQDRGRDSTDQLVGQPEPRSDDRWGASDRSLVTFYWQDKALEMEGALQPSSVHRLVYSGAVRARFRIEGFQPKPPGFSTEELARIPEAAQRFMILDTRGLRLPQSFQDKLSKEWKKWEFSPLKDLGPSMSSPLCLIGVNQGHDLRMATALFKESRGFFQQAFS